MRSKSVYCPCLEESVLRRKERGRDKRFSEEGVAVSALYAHLISTSTGWIPIVRDTCWDVSLMSVLVRGYIVLYYIMSCILAVTERGSRR